MPYKKLMIAMLILLMGLTACATHESMAQTVGTPSPRLLYTAQDRSVSFEYPAEWQVVEEGSGIYLGLSDREFFADSSRFEAKITFGVFPTLNDFFRGFGFSSNTGDPGATLEAMTIVDMMAEIAQAMADVQAAYSQQWAETFGSTLAPTIIISNPQSFSLDGREAARASYVTPEGNGVVLLFELDGGEIVFMGVVSQVTDLAPYEAVMIEVARSLTYTPYILITENLAPITSENVSELTLLTRMLAVGGVRGLAFEPGSEHIAINSGSGIIFYDIATRSVQQTLFVEGSLYGLAISADGQHIATGISLSEEQHEVVILDASTATEVARFTGFPDRIEQLIFSPDASRLYVRTGDFHNAVTVWELATGTNLTEGGLALNDGMSLSPDGTLLAGSSSTLTLHILNTTQDFSLVHEISFDLGWGDAYAFSPDQTRLAVAINYAGDGQFLLLDTTTAQDIARLPARSNGEYVLLSLAYSPDGSLIAAGSGYGDLFVFDGVDGQQLLELDSIHDDDTKNVIFSPDGRLLLTAGQDGAVKFWGIE